MWDIKFLVKEFLHSKSFQEFVNKCFKDKNKVIVDKEYLTYLVMKTGDLFYPSESLITVTSVYQEYKFDDIQRDDIVIDIGACIGGFSIPASRMSDYVYAVEPIMAEELRRNIILNKRNIQVIEAALGKGDIIEAKWNHHYKSVKSMTLSDIKSFCGGCDFLKVDCEGNEWLIKPEELNGIRRIEMEVHKIPGLKGGKPFTEMENMLYKAGFNYKVDSSRSYAGTWIVHGTRE